jgi:hypothetical protein
MGDRGGRWGYVDDVLGFDQAAPGAEVFRRVVLVWIIEPTSDR